jgi:hypothetical protein
MWSNKLNSTTVASDSTYVNPDVMSHIEGLEQFRGTDAANCAGTACSISNSVCTRYGYGGEERFFAGIETANACLFNESSGEYGHKDMSLRKMIEEGYVKAGTTLAITSSQARSGYHVMTVAGVIRDEDGKIDQVLIQANNNTFLGSYSVEEIDTKIRKYCNTTNNRRVAAKTISCSDTGAWANDKAKAEVEQISDADLVSSVIGAKNKLKAANDRLTGIEKTTLALSPTYASYISEQTEELENKISPQQTSENAQEQTKSAEQAFNARVDERSQTLSADDTLHDALYAQYLVAKGTPLTVVTPEGGVKEALSGKEEPTAIKTVNSRTILNQYALSQKQYG